MTGALAALRQVLTAAAEPGRAPAMRAYMREQFDFLGVPTPARRRAAKAFIHAGRDMDSAQLLALAEQLWQQPEREFQYVAIDLLDRHIARLTPDSLPALEALVQSKPWWDSVDGLASWVIGGLVGRHRALQARMDQLSRHPDIWLRRVAILHQLGYKTSTDHARLFDYCAANAGDAEFFIRKAIGWALREYAYTAPDAVRDFVNATPLAPLSRREALKHFAKEPA
ncbi:DNA alkylation repair protein [Chitinimonas sp.]|uniref:DNA alkylation repair protein n=1 Tax=Chitinimonas sp. TaxID=1934313 RepID=UPI0035B29D70